MPYFLSINVNIGVVPKILVGGNDKEMSFFSEDFHKPVSVIRSKRARRFTLRVCQLTGNISITIPLRSSINSAKKFLLENTNWISGQLMKVVPRNYVSGGTWIPVEGIHREIVIRKHLKEVNFLGARELIVDCADFEIGVIVKQFLLGHAAKILTPIIEDNAKYIGKRIKSIRFRDTRTRWGSCSSEGSIMVNWRLIMAPPSVYRYVVIHEVSHLRHMNHGTEFWKLVRSLHPSYLRDRSWLNENGRNLKRFVFESF